MLLKFHFDIYIVLNEKKNSMCLICPCNLKLTLWMGPTHINL